MNFNQADTFFRGLHVTVTQWFARVTEAGHFTQMVWKGTKEIGVGKAFSKDGVYVVVHYHPGGNVMGQFKDNVLRK